MREFYIFGLFALLLVGGIWLYNFLKEKEEERLKALSYKVYLYEKGELSEEEIIEAVKDTPFYSYILSFEERYDKVYELLPEGELKKFYLERAEAEKYLKGNYDGIEKRLQVIKKGDFNFPSVLVLKGFLYEKLGEKDKALGVWATLKGDFPNSYFGKIGELKLRIEGVE